MAHPQPGIFALGTRDHLHLQFDAVGDPAALLDGVRQLRHSANTVIGVNVVVGFGPSAVQALSGDLIPADLVATGPITGSDGFEIPDTQHDLWVWLHGTGQDSVLDQARRAASVLEPAGSLADEQRSFVHGASQDLTGFEDGTENPPLDEAATVSAVPPGSRGAGGSIVLVQRWAHDLDSFGQLDVAEQEQVIGRTLVGSIELDEAELPDDSHVARMVIEDDQRERARGVPTVDCLRGSRRARADLRCLQSRPLTPAPDARQNGRRRGRDPGPADALLVTRIERLVLRPSCRGIRLTRCTTRLVRIEPTRGTAHDGNTDRPETTPPSARSRCQQ